MVLQPNILQLTVIGDLHKFLRKNLKERLRGDEHIDRRLHTRRRLQQYDLGGDLGAEEAVVGLTEDLGGIIKQFLVTDVSRWVRMARSVPEELVK